MPDSPRRRRWPVVVLTLVVALAAIWTGLWFFAASKVEDALAGWRAREAKSGRVYQCSQETVSGFPFRIEVRCADPNVELRGKGPQLALKGKDLLVRGQVFEPTVLNGEFVGPMTVAEPGQPPAYVATWARGQSSVRGTPRNPQHLTLAFDDLAVQRPGEGAGTTVLNAKRLALQGRMVEGTAAANPVIEMVLRTSAAAAPELHKLAAAPLDADITATLRGLADFAPKPWPVRLKELQSRGGSIDIAHARVQQGDVIAVATGALALTASGNLDGELQMTVVGIEQVLKSLDLDAILSKGKVGSAIDKLDRLLPGLSGIARKHAAPGILAGLDAIGKRTTLDGKPAVTLPLRIDDGRVMLGPIPVGRIPPLF